MFNIDATSGVIRTNRSLDRETTARYDLRVVATDRGVPPMSSVVAIIVNVDDCEYSIELD